MDTLTRVCSFHVSALALWFRYFALVRQVSPHPKHEHLQGRRLRHPEVVEGHDGTNHGDRQLPYRLLHEQVLGHAEASSARWHKLSNLHCSEAAA